MGSYADFEQTVSTTTEYWQKYLHDMEPSQFPTLSHGIIATEPRAVKQIPIELSPSSLQLNNFCRQTALNLEAIFQAAWAVVLRAYIGADQICFATGRHDHNITQTTHSLFVCSSHLGRDHDLISILRAMQDDQIRSAPYALTSLNEVPGLGNQALFNSMLLFEGDLRGDSWNDETMSAADPFVMVSKIALLW